MAVIDWPCGLFALQEAQWQLVEFSRSAGPAMSGTEQVILAEAQIWRARLQYRVLAPQRRWWNGLRAQLRGRSNAVRVCVIDGAGATRTELGVPELTEAEKSNGIPYSDDATFSDGVGFAPPPVILAVVDAASRRSTEVIVDSSMVNAPPFGVRFSIDDFLYEVTGRRAAGTGRTAVSFRPPLRKAVSAGSGMTLPAVARMRLAGDRDAGLVAAYHGSQDGVLDLVEVLNR
jgi:hypothetical protein